MRVTDDRTKEELVFADFAGVEQVGYIYHIFCQQGYTVQLGVQEWERLKVLVDQRYIHSPKAKEVH